MIRIQYLSLASAAALALCAASCSNNDFQQAGGQGKIQLALDVDHSVTSRASDEYTATISPDDLSIRLTDAEGKFKEYATVSDFEAVESFSIGDYTLEAFYGDETEEGFQKPYLYGSTSVKVELDQTKVAAVNAKIANSLFKINYTDGLQSYFTDFVAEICSETGKYVEYTVGATDPVYVKSGKVDVYLSFTKPDGTTGRRYAAATIDAKPATCYNLTIDLNNGGTGKALINLTFSDDTEKHDINIDLDLANAAAPEVMADGFTSDVPVAYVTTTEYTNPLNFTVIARGGFKSVVLNTTNSQYISAEWPASVDLMALTTEQQAVYAELGLNAKGLWKNPDQMALIDLSGVLENIRLPKDTQNAKIEFTLTVTDKVGEGQVNDPDEQNPKLVLDVTRGVLNVTPPEEVLYDDKQFTLDITYNANVDNLKYSYYNNSSTYSNLNVVNKADNGNGSYTVTLAGFKPWTSTLTVKIQDAKDETVVAESQINVGPALLITDNNIWATKVDVYVWNGVEFYNSGIEKGYHSTDGVKWTEVDIEDLGEAPDGQRLYRINGLIAGTTNYVTVNHPEKSGQKLNAVSVITEEALQLPNADMEDWTYSDSGNNWIRYYLGDYNNTVWGTNNYMTTQQGVDAKYCRQQGTEPVTDAHGGTYAARIRTIGWGSGNTGTVVWSCVLKYIDAGLLHLGSTRTGRPDGASDRAGLITTDDLNCGLAFASRPESVSFWYKYTPVNSDDRGLVEYWIQDASGNALYSGSQQLASASSYTQVKIPFVYAVNCAKGAKLYLKYSSTYSSDFLQKDSDYLDLEGSAANYLKIGSQLWIDDITLNY